MSLPTQTILLFYDTQLVDQFIKTTNDPYAHSSEKLSQKAANKRRYSSCIVLVKHPYHGLKKKSICRKQVIDEKNKWDERPCRGIWIDWGIGQ